MTRRGARWSSSGPPCRSRYQVYFPHWAQGVASGSSATRDGAVTSSPRPTPRPKGALDGRPNPVKLNLEGWTTGAARGRGRPRRNSIGKVITDNVDSQLLRDYLGKSP